MCLDHSRPISIGTAVEERVDSVPKEVDSSETSFWISQTADSIPLLDALCKKLSAVERISNEWKNRLHRSGRGITENRRCRNSVKSLTRQPAPFCPSLRTQTSSHGRQRCTTQTRARLHQRSRCLTFINRRLVSSASALHCYMLPLILHGYSLPSHWTS